MPDIHEIIERARKAQVAHDRRIPVQLEIDEAPEIDMDGAYRVASYPGVAWRLWGWVTTKDGDFEWTGMEYTDMTRVRAHMVGDDRAFEFDVDELIPLGEDEYCDGCGQIGCGWHS